MLAAPNLPHHPPHLASPRLTQARLAPTPTPWSLTTGVRVHTCEAVGSVTRSGAADCAETQDVCAYGRESGRSAPFPPSTRTTCPFVFFLLALWRTLLHRDERERVRKTSREKRDGGPCRSAGRTKRGEREAMVTGEALASSDPTLLHSTHGTNLGVTAHEREQRDNAQQRREKKKGRWKDKGIH